MSPRMQSERARLCISQLERVVWRENRQHSCLKGQRKGRVGSGKRWHARPPACGPPLFPQQRGPKTAGKEDPRTTFCLMLNEIRAERRDVQFTRNDSLAAARRTAGEQIKRQQHKQEKPAALGTMQVALRANVHVSPATVGFLSEFHPLCAAFRGQRGRVCF